MVLVVFLRGVNVGGHRTFRPSLLVKKLKAHDLVSIGAAGTFVVFKPGSIIKFRKALIRALPFQTDVIICTDRDFASLTKKNPFGKFKSGPDHVRFVSILLKGPSRRISTPVLFPAEGEWFVQIVGARKQFAFGIYRRHMKTIRYLGQIDKFFKDKVTTRNWNTIVAITRALEKRLPRFRGSLSI
jgi:uncharacterized protein (DUF1697 family)